MGLSWKYTAGALADLKGLDSVVSKRITKKIAFFCATSDPFMFAQTLQGPLNGHFRFRVGDYRAIFRKEDDGRVTILLILRVKHRSEAYE